jgi:hypothetical protein
MGIRDEFGVGDAVSISVGRGAGVADRLAVQGLVVVALHGEDGRLKEAREVSNLVVTAGKNHIADQLKSSPAQAAMGWMAVGTGSTAPAAGDTLLGTEIDRNALTSRTAAGNVVTYVGDWAAGDATNAAIAEAGIFNIVTANTVTMLARATFTAINKGASDTLKITWTVTVG